MHACMHELQILYYSLLDLCFDFCRKAEGTTEGEDGGGRKGDGAGKGDGGGKRDGAGKGD